MKKKLIVCGVILLVFAGLFMALTSGLSEGASVTLYGIDLSNIPNGSYTGVHTFRRWSNTLVVHVNENRITGIDIVSDVLGANVTNSSGEIFRRVIEAQNTIVDVVSGATVTSKAYLKAIENALSR